jgi:hypothetical protein
MRRLALLALFVVAGCGSFGLQSHAITLAFKAGDTFKYALHVKVDYTVGAQGLSMPFHLEMNAKDTVTVKTVDSAGTADVRLDLTDMTIKSTVNGTDETHVAKPVSANLKVTSAGHIVSVNGTALTAGSMPDFTGMGSGLISAVLPNGDVKIGDTWTKNYDATPPMGSGTIHVTTNNNYVRDERVGGVNAAVVESKITSNLDVTLDASSLGVPMLPSSSATRDLQSVAVKGTITSVVTSWIDVDGHRMVKTHSRGDTDATLTLSLASPSSTPGFSGPVTFKGTQSVELDPA